MIAEERTSRVAPNGHSKLRRVSTNQTVHSDLYINLEVSSGSMKKGPLGLLPMVVACGGEFQQIRLCP
ncbi:hypothetical protein RHSIM_Rhsim01G0037900 [Rhododendron simsii]|uniref:Uncharacterized protein n=1 Tax=Rhododendron simsii TaxID=118357 RepID=A0A834HDQ0_RHOSS|nr:hypothetical protein RHSIM_Rhsim01G0037900 [Rhododendron simsii]